MHGLIGEYGVELPRGPWAIAKATAVLRATDSPVPQLLRWSLVELLEEIGALSERIKGVEQQLVEPDDVPLWSRGDPTRLRQALLNYASNAVKFTERGVIVLRAALLEDLGNDLLVRFEVQDTGVGVAADKLPGLFRAFEQADTSTTRQYGGTGLGLAITKRLAVLMGGDAGASSVPGEGSTFWFTLSCSAVMASVPLGSNVARMPRSSSAGTSPVPGCCWPRTIRSIRRWRSNSCTRLVWRFRSSVAAAKPSRWRREAPTR